MRDHRWGVRFFPMQWQSCCWVLLLCRRRRIHRGVLECRIFQVGYKVCAGQHTSLRQASFSHALMMRDMGVCIYLEENAHTRIYTCTQSVILPLTMAVAESALCTSAFPLRSNCPMPDVRTSMVLSGLWLPCRGGLRDLALVALLSVLSPRCPPGLAGLAVPSPVSPTAPVFPCFTLSAQLGPDPCRAAGAVFPGRSGVWPDPFVVADVFEEWVLEVGMPEPPRSDRRRRAALIFAASDPKPPQGM